MLQMISLYAYKPRCPVPAPTRRSNLHWHATPKPLFCKAAAAQNAPARQQLPELQHEKDDTLSQRHLELDPLGYFIVLLDREKREIVVDYYTNTINNNGIACDPENGKPIPCTPGYKRLPSKTFRGSSAKQLSVDLFEQPDVNVCSRLEHANYIGRELQKAEFALLLDMEYTQD